MRCDCRGSRFIKKGFGLVYQYQDGYAHRDYDGSVAKSSLYPLPVVPACGERISSRRVSPSPPGMVQCSARCAQFHVHSFLHSGTGHG